VILKNLPSNMVEEAIIILKENKKIKKYQVIERKNQKEYKTKTADGDYKIGNLQRQNVKEENYILKEAEMLVSNYITELETKSPKWKNNMKKLECKYKKAVKLNFILAFLAIISLLLSLI